MTTTVALAPMFREATPADLPHLCTMFEHFRVESPYAQYGPANALVSTALIERLLTEPDGVVLGLEREGALVGMMGLIVSAHPMSGERVATELFWWIEPAHRGMGVWLLRRAERWAIAHDARRMLVVSPQNRVVDCLYETLGYAPMETSWHKSLDWFDQHQPKARTHYQYDHDVTVYDDVLVDPYAYRAMALRQRFQAVHDDAVTFQRMAPCADPALPLWLVQHYPQLTPTLSFFRQGAQDQAEPHFIHTDASMGEWTAILYLTPEPPDGDGTTFWTYRPTGDVGSRAVSADEAARWFDDATWESWVRVAARFNRLVLFPASLYHARALRENYGQGDDARLIQVVFGTGAFV